MLLVLTGINFINYVDRQIIISLGPFIRQDLQLTYAQFGWLITAFMLIHSLTSIPLGILSDRWIRRKIIALGVLFWSAATFASGLASHFSVLLMARAAVGIGEAAYAPPANSLLSDTFPVHWRSRVLGLFNLGMFAGAALGLSLGGIFGEVIGWRVCLFLASVPGFLLAALTWNLREPPTSFRPRSTSAQSLLALFRNPPLMYVCGGGVIAAFSVGALIVWMPQFLTDTRHFGPGDAGKIIGTTGALAGILGVLVGGFLADWLYRRWPWGRMAIIGAGLILSSPFVILALYTSVTWTTLALGPVRLTLPIALLTYIFLAIFFLVWYTAPIIVVIHEVVPSDLKATAQGLYIFLIHFLGDTPSPWIIGRLADSMSLQTALLPLPILNVIGGIIFLVGCRRLTRTMQAKRARQTEAEQPLSRTGTKDL
jgi:predicted MFS family arabinose efflux permease